MVRASNHYLEGHGFDSRWASEILSNSTCERFIIILTIIIIMVIIIIIIIIIIAIVIIIIIANIISLS